MTSLTAKFPHCESFIFCRYLSQDFVLNSKQSTYNLKSWHDHNDIRRTHHSFKDPKISLIALLGWQLWMSIPRPLISHVAYAYQKCRRGTNALSIFNPSNDTPSTPPHIPCIRRRLNHTVWMLAHSTMTSLSTLEWSRAQAPRSKGMGKTGIQILYRYRGWPSSPRGLRLWCLEKS